jgi:predicted RNA-binding protein with TRAM domain
MERRFSRQRFGDRGFGDRIEDFEKPVKIGEEYDVEIKEEGSRGDGIARVKNFVIFVANAKKGDKCKIKITQVRRRFAIGEKVSEAEAVEEEPKEEVTEELDEEEEIEKEDEEVEEEPKEDEEVE